jgi:hypothetical protein
MTNVNTNGQRKTLASQLDRLDTILDTLDEGLQGAVASAVQEAVGLAVREAINGLVTEVLTNPDLLSQVRTLLTPVIVKHTPKPAASGERLHTVVKERFGSVWNVVKARVEETKQTCRKVLRRIGRWTANLLSRVRVLGRFKRQLLLSTGVGLAAGVVSYFAGPYVAAAAGWLGGFVTSIGVQAVLAWERLKAAASGES